MNEIILIKQSLKVIERNGLALGDWLPKKAVMRYFDYCDNQLRSLEQTNEIKVSKIGRRKFYSLNSIITLLEKNIQK